MSKVQLEAIARHLEAAETFLTEAVADVQTAMGRMASALGTARVMIAEIDAAPEPTPEPEPIPEPMPEPEPTPDPVPTPPVVGGDLQSWLASASAGDTIYLPDGVYGSEYISGIPDNITLQAESKYGAHFERITLANVTGLTISDIAGWPLGSTPVDNIKKYCVTGDASANRVIIDGCLFMGHPYGDSYPAWSLAEWRDRAMGGVILDGADCTIVDSVAKGVRFGFALTGNRGIYHNLRAMGVSGDAYRCGGSGSMAADILAADMVYMNDGNHPDAFQAFGKKTASGYELLDGLTIDRFMFVEWLHNDPASPLRFNTNLNRYGIMQGLGMHNAPYSNLTLRDGIVKTGTANGVKVSGVTNATVERVIAMGVDYPNATINGFPAYDKRFPKIDMTGTNISLVDCQAEQFAGSVKTGHNGTEPDYTAPLPSWAQALVA